MFVTLLETSTNNLDPEYFDQAAIAHCINFSYLYINAYLVNPSFSPAEIVIS